MPFHVQLQRGKLVLIKMYINQFHTNKINDNKDNLSPATLHITQFPTSSSLYLRYLDVHEVISFMENICSIGVFNVS